MKKGIVLTISVIIILASLITIVSSYSEITKKHNVDITRTMPIMNAKNLFEDFGFDLDENDGINIFVSRNASEMNISFVDYSPQEYGLLSDLKEFYEEDYVEHSGANISVNVTEGPWIVFSNGLNYIHSESPGESNHTIFGSESAGLTKYVINISVASDRNETSEWDWAGSGDVYIELNYADNNGSIIQSGYLNKSKSNYYFFWYQGSPRPQVRMFFGKNNGEKGILEIIREGEITMGVGITTVTENVENLNAWHNVYMNYSKGSVRKQSMIPAEFEKV